MTLSHSNPNYVRNPYYFNGNAKKINNLHEQLEGPNNIVQFMKPINDDGPWLFDNNDRILKKDLSKSNNEMDSNEEYNTAEINRAVDFKKTKSVPSDLLKRCFFLLNEEGKHRIVIADAKHETLLYMCREIINDFKRLHENGVFDENNDDELDILKFRDAEVTSDKSWDSKGNVRNCHGFDTLRALDNQQLDQLTSDKLLQLFVPVSGRRDWMVLNEKYPGL